ncbi:MAG TPA: DUF177 domain-containing protein [Chloroflexota bacterium]
MSVKLDRSALSSLQFNVSQLLKSDVGTSRVYSFAADGPLDLDGSQARDIHGSVKFMLTNFGIIAGIDADATLQLVCARCLEPFESPTHIAMEEEYRPSIDVITGLPSESPPSDTAFSINQNHTIDLDEAIRQELLLTEDLLPLCSEDCKGLCPTCGINRNTNLCDCSNSEELSPFAVLQQLITDQEAPMERKGEN